MQAGKHEAIVKNVHELLAKLAWDFSPQQLDHLFECFQVRRLLMNNSSYIVVITLLVCFSCYVTHTRSLHGNYSHQQNCASVPEFLRSAAVYQ